MSNDWLWSRERALWTFSKSLLCVIRLYFLLSQLLAWREGVACREQFLFVFRSWELKMFWINRRSELLTSLQATEFLFTPRIVTTQLEFCEYWRRFQFRTEAAAIKCSPWCPTTRRADVWRCCCPSRRCWRRSCRQNCSRPKIGKRRQGWGNFWPFREGPVGPLGGLSFGTRSSLIFCL